MGVPVPILLRDSNHLVFHIPELPFLTTNKKYIFFELKPNFIWKTHFIIFRYQKSIELKTSLQVLQWL